MKQRVSMGNNGQALIITNLKFDKDGFVEDQKAAIVSIDPSINPVEMLTNAGRHVWELFGSRNFAGFYEAKRKRVLNDEELAKQEVATSGRSIINVVVDEEVESVQLMNLSSSTNTPSRLNQEALLKQE